MSALNNMTDFVVFVCEMGACSLQEITQYCKNVTGVICLDLKVVQTL